MSTRATYLSTGLHGFRVRSPAGLSPDYNEFPTLIDGDQFLKTKKGPQNVRFSRLEKTSTFEVRGTCIFGGETSILTKVKLFFFFFFFKSCTEKPFWLHFLSVYVKIVRLLSL